MLLLTKQVERFSLLMQKMLSIFSLLSKVDNSRYNLCKIFSQKSKTNHRVKAFFAEPYSTIYEQQIHGKDLKPFVNLHIGIQLRVAR